MTKKPRKPKAEFQPSDLQLKIIGALKMSDLLGSGDVARKLKEPQHVIVANLAVLEKEGIVTHAVSNWRLV